MGDRLRTIDCRSVARVVDKKYKNMDLSYIKTLLATVPDPEVPVINIDELGVLREVML
jgi:metal-sulfur cluster biosynthetic enzyme